MVNAYILYIEKKPRNKTPQKFSEKILSVLHPNYHALNMKLRKSGTCDKHDYLDGKPHFIFIHPKEKHEDCVVYSNKKIPAGRRKITYFCEKKPGLHPGNFFKRYHMLKYFIIRQ